MKLMVLIVFSYSLFFSSVALGQTSGYLTIKDVRTYASGFLVRVDQSVNPNCSYPDHLQLHINSVDNYNASVSLFMSAWAQGKRIKAYYNGCGPTQAASGGGNVYVTGWYVAH